jgi:hypothetical protein
MKKVTGNLSPKDYAYGDIQLKSRGIPAGQQVEHFLQVAILWQCYDHMVGDPPNPVVVLP